MFPLHCIPEILYAESTDRAKSFPYDPTLRPIHNTSVTDRQTEGRTDERQDDNGTSTPTA